MKRLWKLLDVEPHEEGPVGLLLAISFLMGLFLATVAVASQSYYLKYFDERTQLPKAILYSGAAGILTTLIYNFLQGRIQFKLLAILNILVVIFLTGVIEFGDAYVSDVRFLYQFGFILILPFTFATQLVFWGSFARMFNVRDAKRLVGSVDIGMNIASIIAFFAIPVMLSFGVQQKALYTIGLFSIIGMLGLFIVLSSKYLTTDRLAVKSETDIKKLGLFQFLGNKYILLLSAFIIISTVALRFIDYSFYNISITQFDP
ncbi:MAG: hypothetical protein ACK5R0_13085, partial [Bacteroidota bacterium]